MSFILFKTSFRIYFDRASKMESAFPNLLQSSSKSHLKCDEKFGVVNLTFRFGQTNETRV